MPRRPKSHSANWRRKPTWPQLHFVPGQSETLIVVGDPWTFEVHSTNGKRSFDKHAVNVIKIQECQNASNRTCHVWVMNDPTFRNINFDPTQCWFKVTRHGSAQRDTYYEIVVGSEVKDEDRRAIEAKLTIDLELVAAETRARVNRHRR